MADSNDVPQLEALSAPLGALISAVGRGVAEAQRELDAETIERIRELYASDEDLAVELQRIGYRPTWYHIPEAEAEIAVALSITSEERSEGRTRLKMYGAPLDASYTNRFAYSLTAQSRLKFRVVPVPPSPQAEALVVVPAVVGRTVADARALLSAIGVPHRFPNGAADAAVVTSASVGPGALLPRGTELVLTVQATGGGKLPPTSTPTRSPVLEPSTAGTLK